MDSGRRSAMISMAKLLAVGTTITATGIFAGACSNKRPYELKSEEERREEEAANFAEVARKRDEELRRQAEGGGGGGDGGGGGGGGHAN